MARGEQDRQAFVRDYFGELSRVLAAMPMADVTRALQELEAAHREHRRVFLLGNGGSAATASHMANDLVWGLSRKGLRPLKAIALTDNVPLMTAIANDETYEGIFSRPLETLAEKGDLVVAITGSGNSPNVIRALEVAKRLGLRSVGFLGRGGGKAASMVDVAVTVPSDDYGPIEDVHMALDHLATAYLRVFLAASPGG